MPSVPAPKLLKMLFLSSSVVNELPSEVFPQPEAAVGAGAREEGGQRELRWVKGAERGWVWSGLSAVLGDVACPQLSPLSPLGGAAGPGTGYL